VSFAISTAAQLAGFAQIVNGTWGGEPDSDNFSGKIITLAKNIDLCAYDNWIPIGTDSKFFSGTFDGGGHTVSRLSISADSTTDSSYNGYHGLFGYISGGSVKNLILDSVNISGGEYVGGAAGYVDGGSIDNCSAAGEVNGKSYVGGIAGTVRYKSNMTNCSFTGTVIGIGENVGGVAGMIGVSSEDVNSAVNCYFAGTVSGKDNVGGIAGHIWNSGISGSCSAGAVNGNKNVGGVAGRLYLRGSVTGSYSTGTVSGTDGVGGVAGDVTNNSSLANCYSTGAVNGYEWSAGGVVGRVYEKSSVVNCYSTGAVSGAKVFNGYAGGVVGYLLDHSSVANCAALNPQIFGTTKYVNRVAGEIYAELSNNIAYAEMKNKDGGTNWNNKGADAIDGIDITAEEINSDGTLGGRFINKNGWTTENGKLPGLHGKAVEMPLHLKVSGAP
jgi:hypothetical protein